MSTSTTITFLKDKFLPTTRTSVDYLIHYCFVPTEFVDTPEQELKTQSGSVLVGISYPLLSVWHLEEEDLKKVLFEYAKRHTIEKAEEKALGGDSNLDLTTYNFPQVCPYNPQRIKIGFNHPLIVDVPEENPMSSAEPSALPSQIIDLRDSINAIFGERFKGRLLALPQERHLVELFKQCKDHETFAYRVASMGGLAAAINVKDLKKYTQDEHNKPLNILGAFLRANNFPEDRVNPIMDLLQNFNRLRRMYPVHTDRADGVLEAHRALGLDYPVSDHSEAGYLLLKFYRDCLERILSLLKDG